MNYSELLLDPRWQKKRINVLERDKYTCQLCLDEETTLHIHHKFYLKDYQPWDYKDDDLITYCKHCHALAEAVKDISGCQSILSVFKYTYQGEVLIFSLLLNIQNERHCCIFSYNDSIRQVEPIIALPEHIVTRLSFLVDSLKEKY